MARGGSNKAATLSVTQLVSRLGGSDLWCLGKANTCTFWCHTLIFGNGMLKTGSNVPTLAPVRYGFYGSLSQMAHIWKTKK